MGLFKKPPTPEELEQQKRYEASKARVLQLHEEARVLFYVDQVETVDGQTVLIGELAKGQLTEGDALSIYSCEGILLGGMTVGSIEQREVRQSLFEKGTRTYCTPKETWSGYTAGQLLIQKK